VETLPATADATPPALAEGEEAHPLALELAAGMGQAPLTIEAVKQNLTLLHQIRIAVLDTLVPGKDWGTMPGVDKPFLWENGAHKIGIGFNVFPIHENREREGTDTLLSSGETFPVYEVTSRAKLIWRHNGKTAFIGPEAVCSSAEGKYLDRLWDHTNKWGTQIKGVPLGALRHNIKHDAQKRATVEAIRNFSGAGDRFTQDPDLVWAAGEATTPEQVGEAKGPRPVVKKLPAAANTAPQSAAAPASKAPPATAPASQPAAAPPAPAGPVKIDGKKFERLTGLCSQVTPRTSPVILMKAHGWPPPLTPPQVDQLIGELDAKLKGGNVQ